jgi:subtilisin-like proprotein convertase family protein
MRKYLSLVGTTALTAALAGQAYSFTEKAATHELAKDSGFTVGINVIRPETVAGGTKELSLLKNTDVSAVKTDKTSGAVRILTGQALAGTALENSASGRDFVETALSWINDNQEVLGVSTKDVRLNRNALLIDKDVQFVKFDVYRDGLRIDDASLDFRFKQGQLVQVANLTFAEAASDNRDGRAGLERIAGGMLLADKSELIDTQYRVRQTAKGYELVRVERFDVSSANGRFIVSVEAANGKIFEVRPTEFNLDGGASGQIHARYYAEPLQTVPYGELKLTHNGGAVTTDLSGSFTGAPDGSQPKLDGYEGTRVKIVLKSGVKVVREGQAIRDRWNVVYTKEDQTPAEEDKNVAQSMVYFHTNAIIQHAKRYIASPWFEQQLTANTNLAQTCNAHWDGTTINFYSAGGGCANTGLISDVVYHEWGHGLDHNTGGIQDGAFSEGFGDIMSLLKTRSNILGIGFRTGGGGPVRDLDPDKVYPRDAGGGVHAEGQIIGSTFYDLYNALKDVHGDDEAINILSKYAFKVIFTAARYTEVYDALLVIDDNDADPSNGTPNFCVLNKTFAAHGLATADSACELAAVDEFQIDDSAGNSDGVIDPGESVNIWMNARNASANDLNGLAGVLSVTGATGITVSRSQLSWPMIPARAARRSDTAAALTVANQVACGTAFDIKVNLTSGSRSAVATQKFYVGKLAGLPLVNSVAGLPLPIDDNASTTVEVAVAGDQWQADTKVLNAHLKFDITHTFIGDLSISLTTPDGSVREIYKGSGAADDIHFDQDISDKLAGVVGTGTWQLTVRDSASQDTGTLDTATLTLTPSYFECR